MRFLVLRFFVLVISAQMGHAQHPVFNQAYESQEDWQRNSASRIYIDEAGFIYAAGKTAETIDFSSDSLHIVKMNPKGGYCWYRTYELNPGHNHIANNIIATTDGHLMIAGSSQDLEDLDIFAFLLKVDTLGHILWYKEYGPQNARTSIRHLKETSDGGFVFGFRSKPDGQQNSTAWIVETDSEGNEDWEFNLNLDLSTEIRGIFEQPYGYLVVINQSDLEASLGSMSLCKISGNGQFIENTNPLEAFYSKLAIASSIVTNDDHLLLVGVKGQNGSTLISDGYLVKTDTVGNVVWTTQINYAPVSTETLSRVCELPDGSYIAAGYTRELSDSDTPNIVRGWLVKVNSGGELLWQRLLSFATINHEEYILDLSYSPDGSIVVSGYTSRIPTVSEYLHSNGWIVKLDTDGNDWLPLEVELTASANNVCIGDTVYLDACAFNGRICPYTIAFECEKEQWWNSTESLSDSTIENPYFVAESEGTYSFQYFIVDELGDSANATIQIQVINIPEVESLSEIDTLEAGNSAVVLPLLNEGTVSTAEYTGAAAEFLVTGSNNELLFEPSDPGIFELILHFETEQGCSGTASHTFFVLEEGTGFEQVISGLDLVLFPNPAHHKFSVKLPAKEILIELQMFDLNGKKIYTSQYQTVDVAGIPEGLYLVKLLLASGKIEYRKLSIN